MKTTRLCHPLLLLTGTVLLLMNNCKSNVDQTKIADYQLLNNEIELTENSVIESNLKCRTIEFQYLESELKTTGIVKIIPDRFAQIASPFPGRVIKSFVKLGEFIRKGTPVFELRSSDYFSAQQDYFSAQQELKQATVNLNRQKELYAHNVGIKRELEEAETVYKLKKITLDQMAASLQVFNSSLQTKIGESLIVRSPISGTVVNNDLIVGEFLKEDHEALVAVAELSKVWVSAQIKEHDIGFLTNLKNMRFTVDALSGKVFNGKIINIGQLLNEETRSVDVLIEAENLESVLKPGMYVNVVLSNVGKQEILLPKKAVFQEHQNQYVFVKTGKRRYRKTRMKGITISQDSQFIRVTEGLKAGEEVVVEGGIFLMGAK
ncbi:efflux RND transporter periplasmic adaptor subunit [Empedobacter brevis]|uniref:efflux RND transporter periplasmic adaptor subunit n=1 Tax=Empedobacter brevis TaxID=247 RepID=UPI0028AEF222|nr:efflux RND transporter periplasmic adaptor subunit [Empedobacter brevis]